MINIYVKNAQFENNQEKLKTNYGKTIIFKE